MTFYLSGQVPNTRTGGVRRGLCFLLALAAARVPAAVPQPSDPAAPPEAAFRYPVVTAPVMLQAPEVDGRVDTAEWASAAQVAGLHILDGTTAIEDPACWWVGRTADALHLAFRFDRPPHTAAAPAVSEAQLRLGDFCEVFLRPPGKDCDYVFLVNPAGMGQAALRTIRTGHRTTTWSHAARETATGWEGELSIPFASLEEAPPAPGTSWKMSLTRNQKAPEKEVGVSSWIANWRSLDEGVDLRFGEPAAPAVRLLEAGPLTPAEAGLLLEVAAPRASARVTIACTLLRQTRAMTEQVSTHIGEMLLPDVREMSVFWIMDARGLDAALAYYEPVASWMQELEVAAGQAARLPLAAATEPGDYLLTWLVRDTASGQLLLGGALPFAQQPPLNVAVQQWLLVAQCLAVEAEYRRAVNLPPGTQLVAELLDPAGETVLARAETAADLTRRRSLLRLPAVDRWGQRLRVRTTMRGPAGQILNEVSTDLQLPDHPPEWYPNEIGITDEVLPRWTPIRLGTAADPAGTPVETASVVLRDYHLRPSGLPARILSRDEELLSGPIELTLAGAPLDWTRALLEQKPGKVVWEARATREALALTLRTTLEFDGMIRYDLTLTPAETTRINDLALSIPYRAAVNIEPLQSWDRFEPMVMLGDFERGLCWFCESARGWKLGPRPAIEQTLTGETIDWQIRFIAGEGREISEPLSFTWGLQALPVREMDNTYQYTERRLTHGHPDMARTLLEEPELTETALRYPLEGNLPVEQGALRFHWIYNNLGRGTIPLLRLGAGPETLEIQFGTVRELGRGFTLALTQGGQRLIQLHPIYRSVETPWTPVGLSWRRQGESMQLILATAKPNGQAQYATATLPAAAWQSALAQGELTFGGAGTIALDDLVVSRAFLDGPALVAAFTQPAAVNPDTTLVDPFDSLRFYRANYLTQPLQIATGRGGVAGAALYGGFVRRLPGRTGKALVLPSAEPRTVLDWAKSLGATHGVYHEQYHVRHGHYEPPYAPDPLWAESLQEGLRNGWGMAFYDGFGHHRQYDTRIGPFMDELRLMPESVIGYPNSPSPAPGMSRAAADYKVWGWKQAIDEYGVYGMKSDNGLNCRSLDLNLPLGFGWYDDNGDLQGTYPFFATRELAKRYYWLFHVYRKEKYGRAGVIKLHAGAAWYPFVAAFVDYRAHGEGANFMSAHFAENLTAPEDFVLGRQHHRFGIPVYLLTKRMGMPFSPNYLYLYAHLFHMDLRAYPDQLRPSGWHWNEKDPYAGHRGGPIGEFAPYHTGRPGVHSTPCPQGISWMLKDDFGCQQAEFLGFWRNQDYVQVGATRAAASLWLHPGQAALFVVSNFHSAPDAIALRLNLARLGLAGQTLRAYDAWTDEDYPLTNDAVHLTIPGGQYRFVRLEPEH